MELALAMKARVPSSVKRKGRTATPNNCVKLWSTRSRSTLITSRTSSTIFTRRGKRYGEDVEIVNKKALRLNWTPATIRHLWEPICKNGVKYDSETVHLKLLRLLFRYVIRPASSAGSERTYSILEASATKLRANLTPKTLTNLLCLACKEE